MENNITATIYTHFPTQIGDLKLRDIEKETVRTLNKGGDVELFTPEIIAESFFDIFKNAPQ